MKKNTFKQLDKLKNYVNKKMIGGGPILQSDIKYKDNLVSILNPEIKKGIIIWSQYSQPNEMDCSSSIKNGLQ